MKLYAIAKMQGGAPDLGADPPKYHGFCFHGQKGGYGAYTFTGTGAELLALAQLPTVYPICTKATLEEPMVKAARDKLNVLLAEKGLVQVSSITTGENVIKAIFKAIDKNHAGIQAESVNDPEEKLTP